MTTIFEPKIFFVENIASLPDSYDSINGIVPHDDFVVSRHKDGSVASYYRDLSWNQTAYEPDGRTSWLHFPYWEDKVLTPEREKLSKEARFLMFILQWKRPGSSLSIGSCRHYLNIIRSMADFSESNACRIQDIFSNEEIFSQFIYNYQGSSIKFLSGLMSLLQKLGPRHVGFSVLGKSAANILQDMARKFNENYKQHPVIPTRIYSYFIAGLNKQIADFEVVSDRFLSLLVKCSQDRYLGRFKYSQTKIAKRSGDVLTGGRPDFCELLARYGLEEYFAAKGLKRNVQGLTSGITEVQMLIKLQIQTFSGMRDDEATNLPYYCLEHSVTNGKTHYLIAGRTTKLNEGRIKRTKWVTSKEVNTSIQLAQRIADAIYLVVKDKPKKSDGKINHYPLFVSVAYVPFCQGKNVFSSTYLPGILQFSSFNQIKERILLRIEDADINELEEIDPHRAWRSESKFQIGFPWHLSSHQLRRSLALYAQRSGLVSLPSLRRQLQHITEEMSRYYARGSAFAKNFIGDDKKHFGFEWQDTQPVSAALSYVLNVLVSDDVLFGGHASWVDNRLRSADGTVVVDREKTMRRFKKGELSYRETLLGGCTKVGQCDDVAIRWIDIDCLKGCPNMVVKLPNLERIIAAQKRLIASIDTTSIEYRSEKADLDVLISIKENMLQKQLSTAEVL